MKNKILNCCFFIAGMILLRWKWNKIYIPGTIYDLNITIYTCNTNTIPMKRSHGYTLQTHGVRTSI